MARGDFNQGSAPERDLRGSQCPGPRPLCSAVPGTGFSAYRRAGSSDGRGPCGGPSEKITGEVLDRVFRALYIQRVSLEGMLLKPNMVVSGKDCREQSSVAEVAKATLRCLRRHVPPAVPGIVFLSGGQDEWATEHFNAMNTVPDAKPWRLTFSYGRALQDPALTAWGGKPSGIGLGQQALYRRARCNSAASLGKYNGSMETDADKKTRAQPAGRSCIRPLSNRKTSCFRNFRNNLETIGPYSARLYFRDRTGRGGLRLAKRV